MERAGDLAKKQAHPAYSSFPKYYGTELNKRRHELIVSSLGSDGLEWESARSQEGDAPRAWLRTKANSIEGRHERSAAHHHFKRILDLPGGVKTYEHHCERSAIKSGSGLLRRCALRK